MGRKRVDIDSSSNVGDTNSRSVSKKKQCELLVVEVVQNSNGDGTPKSTDVDFQKDLFDRMRSCRLHPKWITTEECMRKKAQENEVFILLNFSGVVFNHLRSLNCRIYGTVAALTCIMNGERLPKWTHPILSMTFKDCIICFTGIEQHIREAKTDCIMKMNGIVSKDLNDKTTHLIAKECNPNSLKYVVAVKRSIPVLSINWVDSGWDAAHKGYTVWFGEEDIYREYRLKIFAQCVITCSGVSSSERMTIAHIVRENGGLFTPEMERNRCTHLLTDKNCGEKYRRAREWGWDCVKIVKLKWLDRCVQKGARLEERLYEPKFCSTAKTSTPQTDGVPEANFDVSGVSGVQQHTLISRTGNTLSPQPGPSNVSGQLERGGIEASSCTNATSDASMLRRRSAFHRSYSTRSIEQTAILNPIEAIGLKSDAAYDCLENCRLLLCAFNEEEMPNWKRVVNALGATQLPGMYADVTHVVVGPQTIGANLLEKLKEISSTVSVVTCKWLIECGNQQKMVDEKEFLHPVVYADGRAQHDHPSLRKELPYERPSSSTSTPLNCAPKETVNGTKHRGLSAVDERLKGGALTNEKGAIEALEKATAMKKQSTDRQHSDSVFAGISFGIDRMEETLADDLKATILELGGECETDEAKQIDYLLLPLLHYGDVEEVAGLNVGSVVSAFWMQECIGKGEVLDPNSHPLYRPLSASLHSRVFEGCVVALSSMERVEKETYAELLRTFGGIVQNRLVKRDVAGERYHRNTHVVTCDEGERTNCARKWQIPVVDPSWIIESIIKNEKQPDEKFAFEEKQLKGYVRSDQLWVAMSGTSVERSLRQCKSALDQLAPDVCLEAPAVCTTARSVSDGCVVLADPVRNSVHREDQRPPDNDDDVVIIETPVNKRLKMLRSDNTSQSASSPSEDTPSKFLDPNTKFIPRFDLRDAYAVVDALHSCRTSSLSAESANWSESMVERLLEEAATKTATTSTRASTEMLRSDLVTRPDTANEPCMSRKLVDSCESEHIPTKKVSRSLRKSSPNVRLQKSLPKGQRRPSEEHRIDERHKNMAKQRMMEEKLANLAATYDDDGGSEPSNPPKDAEIEYNLKRKRCITESEGESTTATSSKQDAQKALPESAIGWEEAPLPCSEIAEKRSVTLSSSSITSLVRNGNGDRVDGDLHDDGLPTRPPISKKARQKSGSGQVSVVDSASKGDIVETKGKEPPERNTNHSRKRRFAFSSLSFEERELLGAFAKQLGAEICSDFDDDVTHLCCGSIVRNVKLMRAICAGKYVIVPEYIEGSHSAGKWLEEVDFEWGSEANVSKRILKNLRQEKLALACHRWRVKVEETSRKAFHGWCVLFYCSQRRLSDLAKIVECGGGTWRLRDEVTLTPDTLGTFTLALVEHSRYWTDSEIDLLIERGLYCYPLDYLSTHLMETHLNPEQFLHKDYVARLQTRKDSTK